MIRSHRLATRPDDPGPASFTSLIMVRSTGQFALSPGLLLPTDASKTGHAAYCPGFLCLVGGPYGRPKSHGELAGRGRKSERS
jgi:hypothetical protein